MLGAPTWDQISTGARVKKATMGTARCASRWTPARLTSETAQQSPRCADTEGLDRLTASVSNITATLSLEWDAV